MQNTIKIKGTVEIKQIRNGEVIKSFKGENIITNAGKAQIALLAGDATAVPFTYLAVGTGSTAAAVTDTTLVTEITDTGLARAAATVSRTTTTVTNDTLSLSYTWTATGAKTIAEVGMFNASSSGTMLGRKLTSAITTANTDQIVMTYTVAFA
ncbi:MAG: hypothetical protein WC648_01245 [Candidatus Paceibacterota bacterium]|jgi:hypothetical protein